MGHGKIKRASEVSIRNMVALDATIQIRVDQSVLAMPILAAFSWPSVTKAIATYEGIATLARHTRRIAMTTFMRTGTEKTRLLKARG